MGDTSLAYLEAAKEEQQSKDRKLAHAVALRKKLVTEILKYCSDLAVRRGKCTLRDESSDHTHTVWELKEFFGFDFWYESGRTYCGGSELRIAYNFPPGINRLVFDADWQLEENLKVLTFDPSKLWLRELRGLMHNEAKRVERLEKQKAAEEATRQRNKADEKRRMELASLAKRLLISV